MSFKEQWEGDSKLKFECREANTNFVRARQVGFTKSWYFKAIVFCGFSVLKVKLLFIN